MSKSRGFTLIELLVVIAIIGILSSVVISNLTKARSRGIDAAIKAEIANMKTGMEMYYDGKNTYEGATTTLTTIFAGLASKNVTPVTFASENSYAISAQLKEVNTMGFCIDSDGNATTTTWANIDSLEDITNGCM